MKFTNGFWLVRPEFTANYARQVRHAQIHGDGLSLYCPFRAIEDRGDTLNLGMLTLEIDTPMEDVLHVKILGHAGAVRNHPSFPISESHAKLRCGSQRCESGRLAMEWDSQGFGLRFLGDETLLTRCGPKSLARMTHKDGRSFLVCGLDLGVGELVYGLGERFGALVKNGQSIDIWNEDGGTSSDISYKNIPFYLTNRGYGVFVDHPGRVSFEVASEKVEQVQFSVEDEQVSFYLIYGPTPKEILTKYTALTGRPALVPAWSFGLWLTTSFTTNYDEKTVSSFTEEMARRRIPLHVFHFDCFWMKEFEWCSFSWDQDQFPDPVGMLERMHRKGYHICVWINPYIGQKSPLFAEAAEKGYLLHRKDGMIYQTDLWQAGMGIVDFTNPQAEQWFAEKLSALLDMGVDCFKTDFGERIPENALYFNGADPQGMHNYYTYLYNRCVFRLLQRKKPDAVLFARSATAGCQQFPVHWGGDSTSQYPSMAETLRGGLSLAACGFGFWSHDIGGFEETATPDLYKRWVAFGLLSSHSRLHGSTTYRVPWNYDEEACEVLRTFVELKCSLMPYLYAAACETSETGIPMMRPMHLEFPNDRGCGYLDQQYMLGDALLVAPVFCDDGTAEYYLPQGRWVHFLSGQQKVGGWHRETYDYFSLPLFQRENTIVAVGSCSQRPDYDYTQGTVLHIYAPTNCTRVIRSCAGEQVGVVSACRLNEKSVRISWEGLSEPRFLLRGVCSAQADNASVEILPLGACITPHAGETACVVRDMIQGV